MGQGIASRRMLAVAGVIGVLSAASCGASDPAPAPATTPPPVESLTTPATPPPADVVVGAAVKRAAAEGKVVLIEFGASWCVWCKHFEALVTAPETREAIASNFVVLNLTVREREEKKVLEHPGAATAMERWGGAKAGLPFYVFLDARGNKIADSNAMPDQTNIGFPATKLEVERFMALIERTAPKLTADDRAAIARYLQRGIQS
jgi:thiol:disulfide interchange protein